MRRTPALTAQARELWIAEVTARTWNLYGTTARIAEATGLTHEQVRDAIYSEPADKWRNGALAALKQELE